MSKRKLFTTLSFLIINIISHNLPALADSSDNLDRLIQDIDSQIQETEREIQKTKDDEDLENRQIDYICNPIKEESTKDECKLIAMFMGTKKFIKLAQGAISAPPKIVRSLGHSCQKIVPNLLKSPASARFPDKPEINEVFSGIYFIHGSVDSQNSYGALLRASYFCYMRNIPKKGVELMGVEISEPGR